MAMHRPGPVLRWVLKVPALLYRARLGRLLGQRFLLLTHVGRQSGRTYRAVLEVVGRRAESGEYVVMAGFGPRTDWLRNVQADGAREVVVGRRTFRPAARLLTEEEAADVLADYERRNRLVAPAVRVVLSRLVGWRYTGTDAERRRLVTLRPLVAFRPVDAGSARGR
jgi:deazaflavin-dependent oxidoreductase (nitroreductase family)